MWTQRLKILDLTRLPYTSRSGRDKVFSGGGNVVLGFSPQAARFGLKPQTTLDTVPLSGLSVCEMRANASQLRLDRAEQIIIAIEPTKLRELRADILRRMKEKSGVRFHEHRGVVKRITCGDDPIIQ